MKKAIVEKKIKGLSCFIYKKKNDIKIFSMKDQEEITNYFPEFVEKFRSITPSDIILEGSFVGYSELGQEIVPTKRNKYDHARYYIWDILWYNQSLENCSWNQRHGIIRKLNLTDEIVELKSLIVKSEDEINKAISLMKTLTDELIIKPYTEPNHIYVLSLKKEVANE
jgi:ATP-dependent DNA ligase